MCISLLSTPCYRPDIFGLFIYGDLITRSTPKPFIVTVQCATRNQVPAGTAFHTTLSPGTGFVLELIGTLLLVFLVLATTNEKRGESYDIMTIFTTLRQKMAIIDLNMVKSAI